MDFDFARRSCRVHRRQAAGRQPGEQGPRRQTRQDQRRVCARGYNLYAAVNADRRIVVWSVMGLNEDEKTLARHALLPNLPPLTRDGLVLTDSHYDSAPLHEEVSEPLGLWLAHPLRGQDRAGGKNRWWKLLQMPATRRALVHEWEHHPELMRCNRAAFIHRLAVLTELALHRRPWHKSLIPDKQVSQPALATAE